MSAEAMAELEIRSVGDLVNLLRQARILRGWSKNEMARQTGLADGAVRYVENGRTGSPSAETVLRWGRALDLTILVRWDPEALRAAAAAEDRPRAPKRRRRKVTDPARRARLAESLVKARAVRAAKRALLMTTSVPGSDVYDELSVESEPRCEDCGIRLDRHGSECGMEIDDPRAEGYFPPAGWARPTSPEEVNVDGR